MYRTHIAYITFCMRLPYTHSIHYIPCAITIWGVGAGPATTHTHTQDKTDTDTQDTAHGVCSALIKVVERLTGCDVDGDGQVALLSRMAMDR